MFVLHAITLATWLYSSISPSMSVATSSTPFDEFGCNWLNFTQNLDHFNSSDTRTFTQRYIVCPKAWPTDPSTQKESGNVILFLGNESPLSQPQQPIVFENAARMNALVIVLEHRYYGASLPFQPDPDNGMLTTEQYKYLTMQNVLEDSKIVLQSVRKEYNIPEQVPALVIGGSYGGQLAMYHRLTFPNVYAAAIAASAPVNYVLATQMLNETVQSFHDVIGKAVDVVTGNATCAESVRQVMDEIFTADTSELSEIATSMDLCNATQVLKTPKDAWSLVENLYYAWGGSAVQINGQCGTQSYINDSCDIFLSGMKKDPQGNAFAAMGAAVKSINGVNSSDCYPFDNTYVSISNPATAGTTMASYMYQCCTQRRVDQTMFTSTGAAGTLIPAFVINSSFIEEECREAFGPEVPPLTPLPVALGYRNILSEVGNVVFTNGDLDGWSGGGIMEDIPGVKMATVVYKNASHCTDTHNANWDNTEEPPEYKRQRAEAVDAALVWMQEWRENRGAMASGAVGRMQLFAGLMGLLVGTLLLGG